MCWIRRDREHRRPDPADGRVDERHRVPDAGLHPCIRHVRGGRPQFETGGEQLLDDGVVQIAGDAGAILEQQATVPVRPRLRQEQRDGGMVHEVGEVPELDGRVARGAGEPSQPHHTDHPLRGAHRRDHQGAPGTFGGRRREGPGIGASGLSRLEDDARHGIPEGHLVAYAETVQPYDARDAEPAVADTHDGRVRVVGDGAEACHEESRRVLELAGEQRSRRLGRCIGPRLSMACGGAQFGVAQRDRRGRRQRAEHGRVVLRERGRPDCSHDESAPSRTRPPDRNRHHPQRRVVACGTRVGSVLEVGRVEQPIHESRESEAGFEQCDVLRAEVPVRRAHGATGSGDVRDRAVSGTEQAIGGDEDAFERGVDLGLRDGRDRVAGRPATDAVHWTTSASGAVPRKSRQGCSSSVERMAEARRVVWH